jgi:hypothetical protein
MPLENLSDVLHKSSGFRFWVSSFRKRLEGMNTDVFTEVPETHARQHITFPVACLLITVHVSFVDSDGCPLSIARLGWRNVGLFSMSDTAILRKQAVRLPKCICIYTRQTAASMGYGLTPVHFSSACSVAADSGSLTCSDPE